MDSIDRLVIAILLSAIMTLVFINNQELVIVKSHLRLIELRTNSIHERISK